MKLILASLLITFVAGPVGALAIARERLRYRAGYDVHCLFTELLMAAAGIPLVLLPGRSSFAIVNQSKLAIKWGRRG